MSDERSIAAQTIVGTVWVMLWRMVTRALGLISTLLLARLLVPADFGLVAMASTFIAVIDALSELGLEDALIRLPGDATRLYDTAFTLQVARALLTSLIVAAAAPLVGQWFNEPRLAPVVLVLAGGSVISGFENIGVVEFRKAMRFDMQFRLLSLSRILQVIVTVSTALVTHSHWALLAGVIAGRIVRLVMTYVVHPYRPRLALAGWRDLAGFSFWTWATCAASLIWERCDPFVLGPRIGTSALGVYLVAFELATLPISEVVAPAATVLFAGFSRAQQRGESSIHHAPLVATMLVMALMPVIVTISCASGYVTAALLGPNWLAAEPLIAVLAWLCVFSPFSYVCSVVLVANGLVRRNFIGNVVVSMIKLCVLLVAVAVTDRLPLIAAAATACVAAESVVYWLLLSGNGPMRLRETAAGLARALAGGAASVFVLHHLGLAWQHIEMAPVPAFLDGAAIGALALTVHVVVVGLIWQLVGRPVGPETKFIELLIEHGRPVMARLRRWRPA